MHVTHLLAALARERAHVLRAVDGLGEDDLARPMTTSGWSIIQLLNHLALDDEMFWVSAVLGGDASAIADLHDGWSSTPMTGAQAVELYRQRIALSDETLATVDLGVPPRWWPPAEVFGGAPMSDGFEVVLRVLTETSVHAGHLDIVREGIDGHRHLVVTGDRP